MSYKGFLKRDLSLPPVEAILLAAFFALSTGISVVLLVYVLVNTLALGYWTIAAVAAGGVCVAAGLFYVGISQTYAFFE